MRLTLARSRISWFLAVLVSTILATSFIMVPAGNAAVADTATPVLTSFSLSGTQAIPGQQVTFSYVATDDSGSLSQLSLGYSDSFGHVSTLTFDNPPVAGSVAITVPATWTNGKVWLENVSLTDTTGNKVRYARGGHVYLSPAGATGPTTHTLAFTAGDLTVSGSTADMTAPTLVSLSTSGSPAGPGQTISVHYEATDASGSLSRVLLKFHDQYQIDRYVTSTATAPLPLSGVVDQVIPATWPNGAYVLDYAILTDAAYIQGAFLADGTVTAFPAAAQGPSTHTVDLGAATFNVSGSVNFTPPVLTSIKRVGSLVAPGGTASLSYTAESPDQPLTSVTFRYTGPYSGSGWTFTTGTGSLTGTLPVTIPVDSPAGPYSLLDVTLRDSAGNTSTYHRDGTTTRTPSLVVGTHTLALAGLDILVANRPSAPSMFEVSARSRSALVSWFPAQPQDPSVTGYTVTAQPGGRTVSTNSSATQVVMTGLPNDTTYRFTVTAKNAVGVSPASAASVPVTPRISTNIIGTGDFSGDGRADLMGVRPDNLAPYLYRGNGAGGFGAVSQLTQVFERGARILFSPGLFDGWGVPDILVVDNEGCLLNQHGDGHGSFGPTLSWIIGCGWGNMRTVFGPGDFSGDRKPDIMAVRPDGGLFLYRGTLDGYVQAGQRIGNGWAGFLTVFSTGDFSGDGRSDVLAVSKDGGLYMYRGNGRGGFAAGGQRIGNGWANFTSVISTGDFSGDHKSDLMAVNDAGELILYRGNGRGGFGAAGQKIGKGWAAFR